MNHKFSDDVVDDALRNSSVGNMETITGKHWSQFTEEENRQMLALVFRENEAKRRILASRDDNVFGGKLAEFERIVSDIGFRQVLEVEFQARRNPVMESFRVWWLDAYGILLTYDTYYGRDTVNSGNFGYNYRLNEWIAWEERCGVLSSHSGREDGIIAGSHDCREAMRRKIDRLLACGEFVVPWKSASIAYISLLHHSDFSDDMPMRDRIKAGHLVGLQRAEMLPADVREATGLVEHFKSRSEKADIW